MSIKEMSDKLKSEVGGLTVAEWVWNNIEDWRNSYEQNYAEKDDEYYRIFRGQWAPEDRTRNSERSRIVTPATQQAVESSTAEIEEATFGRGDFFDIRDDYNDQNPEDIGLLKKLLKQEFKRSGIRGSVGECILNAAIFGTGIGELVLEEYKEQAPATQDIMGGQLKAVGINITERPMVRLRPILPQNFLIDPVARSVDEAMGVAIDEFVPKHHVEMLQEQGVYEAVPLVTPAVDWDIEPDEELQPMFEDNKLRVTRYYGLVPTDLLVASGAEVEDTSQMYTEAIVIIANEGVLLKAEENPYMMGDRPIVAFAWDTVPGRFRGRGVVEKAYNSQKALDAEIRARIDALALTVHPMMAMDATRIPKGTKPEVRPGKILLTNGDPKDVLNPFNFGQVSQITFAQAAALQDMVQQATGAIDSTGIAGQVNGEATAAGISMSLGAIIKRHKRTLVNFQDNFLIPFVTKAAWRYMQFDPDRYPVNDFNFCASSSLGIIAREYEVSQLIQLMQTMGQDSPLYPTMLMAIIDNMSLANRDELLGQLKASMEPNPQEQQMAQQAQMQQMEFQDSQIKLLMAQAEESKARGQKYSEEAAVVREELEIDKFKAASQNLENGVNDDKEFERRLKIMDLELKRQEAEDRRKAVKIQENTAKSQAAQAQMLEQRLTPVEPQQVAQMMQQAQGNEGG